MKDNIDEIILKNIVSTPKNIGGMIISTTDKLYNEEKEKTKYSKIYKAVVGLCASILITTGVVFAKDINNYIRNIFNLGEHGYGDVQIEEAIHNNYLQYNSGEYIEENGVKYKLEHSLLNDINLIFSIDFITDFNIDEFENLSVSGLKIEDEKGNQIHVDSESQEIWTKNIAQTMRFTKIKKSNNEISVAFTLVSNQFPKINTLYISFDKITMYTVNKGVVNSKEIKGNYNLKLDIDNKFNDRNTVNYSFKTISNNSNIDLEKVILTNTGLGVTFNSNKLETIGYNFELFDTNFNKLYSNKNDIYTIGNSDKYFVWLDINDDIKGLDNFILKVIDLDGNVSQIMLKN